MNDNALEEPNELIIGSTQFNHSHFKNNYIRTTKYTSLNFLPICLFNQLRRYSYIYFVIIAILHSIPQFSPLGPISAWAPLIFVLGLSIMRESFEDLARYKSDLETNSTKTQLQSEGEWKLIESKNLFVGDIVKISNLEHFPADIIALASSDQNGKILTLGSCIDGDKDLKEKKSLKETQELIGDSMQFVLMGTLKFGIQNENYDSFKGSLAIGESPIPISAKNLLLRGTMLKNTNWVIGLVVYTGKDAKIMQNSQFRNFKQTKVELYANWLIILMISIILLLSVIVLIGSAVWNANYSKVYAQFIPIRYSSSAEAFMSFLSSLVLFSSIIPVTLIMTLEMARVIQSYFINKDIEMLDTSQGRFSKVFNTAINEDLGQVKYIFADKTGTLTSNMLEFKSAFIGDTLFGDQLFLENKKDSKKKPTYVNKTEGIYFGFYDRRMSIALNPESKMKSENFVFRDVQNKEIFWIRNQSELIYHVLLGMSICHNCIIQSDAEHSGKIKYSGIYQDEVVLVDASRHLGFILKESTDSIKTVEINGENKEIEVLNYFEFNSSRRRSSIIARHDGYIKHFIKGAGEVIGERLNHKIEQPYLEKTEKMIEKMHINGLRTLCFGLKIITLSEYKEIEAKLKSFEGKSNKETLRNDFIEKIENDFLLLGCVAIEDKLQKKVAEVIADFVSADIRVWMLTGDKKEIAESVGYNCKLIDNSTKKIYLLKNDSPDAKFAEFRQTLDHKNANEKVTLIMENFSISDLIERKELAKAYAREIFAKCDSVIASRMTSFEKGQLTKMMKEYTQEVVLAIGDGANDVDMIQNANVGVGIYGQEGMKAIQGSDYGLVDFESLWKLIFVHGHWSYIRTTELLQMFYFKNLLFVIPQFLYCFYNCFSAQTLYDEGYVMFFHLFFTSIPLIVRGSFDQDVYYKKWTSRGKNTILDQKNLFQNKNLKQFFPYLYYIGQKNTLFRFDNQVEILFCVGKQSHYFWIHHLFFHLCHNWKRHYQFERPKSEYLVCRNSDLLFHFVCNFRRLWT